MKNLFYFFTFLFFTFIVSCTDSHYDLDQVDATVGVGGDDFSILGNNTTEEIPLEDIFDIEESRFMHVAENGDYILTGTNTVPFNMSMSMDPITIHSATTREKIVSIDLTDFSSSENAKQRRAVKKELSVERTLASVEYESTDIPDKIDKLDYMHTEATMRMKVEFNDNVLKVFNKMALVKIQLPKFIDVGEIMLDDNPLQVDEDNCVTLVDVVPPSIGYSMVTMTVKGINLTKGDDKNYVIFEKGKRLYAKGDMTVYVTVKIEDINIFYLESPYIFSAKCTAEMSDTKITGIEGIFDITYERDMMGKLIINSYPEFLLDPDVRLKLYDPHIDLIYENDLPFDGIVTGHLVATDRYGNHFADIPVPPFKMKGQGNGVVSIRRIPAPSTEDSTIVAIDNLMDIVNILPCKVELWDVKIKNASDGRQSVKLGYEYQSNSHYMLHNNLSLAAGGQVVKNDTVKQLHDWVKDLRFKETVVDGKKGIDGYVQMDADVESKIPAYITITAFGIDHNGDSISTERLYFTVDKVVPASRDGVIPSKCHLTIVGRAADNDVFKILDQIKFHMIGSASDENGQNPVEGVPINAYNQTIKLTNVILKKHGKIVGDFNE